jgi:hypothetical protein
MQSIIVSNMIIILPTMIFPNLRMSMITACMFLPEYMSMILAVNVLTYNLEQKHDPCGLCCTVYDLIPTNLSMIPTV